jgi:hypothetical protein
MLRHSRSAHATKCLIRAVGGSDDNYPSRHRHRRSYDIRNSGTTSNFLNYNHVILETKDDWDRTGIGAGRLFLVLVNHILTPFNYLDLISSNFDVSAKLICLTMSTPKTLPFANIVFKFPLPVSHLLSHSPSTPSNLLKPSLRIR